MLFVDMILHKGQNVVNKLSTSDWESVEFVFFKYLVNKNESISPVTSLEATVWVYKQNPGVELTVSKWIMDFTQSDPWLKAAHCWIESLPFASINAFILTP